MTGEEFERIEKEIDRRLAQITLSDDPVEEVHQIREAMAAAQDFNMDAIYEFLREDQRRAALAGTRFYSHVGDEWVDVTDKVARGE